MYVCVLWGKGLILCTFPCGRPIVPAPLTEFIISSLVSNQTGPFRALVAFLSPLFFRNGHLFIHLPRSTLWNSVVLSVFLSSRVRSPQHTQLSLLFKAHIFSQIFLSDCRRGWTKLTHTKIFHTVQMMANCVRWREYEKFCFQLILSYEETGNWLLGRSRKYCHNPNANRHGKVQTEPCFITTAFLGKSFEVSYCMIRNVFARTCRSPPTSTTLLYWLVFWKSFEE